MQGVPPSFEHSADRAEFRRLPARAGIELYQAHIVKYAFEPHTHEAFGFGAIEHGVERFRYAGCDHLAPAESIVMMNPDVLHTGSAETKEGWRYRMIYIDAKVLGDICGQEHWWFADAVISNDPARARRMSFLLESLWQTQDTLAFDSLLVELVAQLQPLARTPTALRADKNMRFEPVLDYMRAHLDERLVLEDLARVVDLSPFHFLRLFKAQHHATPQQMLMALRLYKAKELLAQGHAPAQAAATVGLSDQAHLTKAFSQRYGVTPARYQRQVRS
jgi:AraC-like DNA-binding protein